MATVRITSGSTKIISQTYFSSHLKPFEQPFVHKLEHLHMETKKEEDGEEISVFGAEKYFNGGMDEENHPRIPKQILIDDKRVKDDESVNIVPMKPKVQVGAPIPIKFPIDYKHVKDEAVDIVPMKPKVHVGTPIPIKFPIDYKHVKDESVDMVPMKPKAQPRNPSVHSESSCNSESALLESVQRNPSQKMKNKKQGKNLLAILGCSCSCYDNDSVDINEHVGETNSKKIDEVGIESNREILNPNPRSLAAKLNLHEDSEDRMSLEVVGSPILERKNKSSSIEKRLAMLRWETSGRMENDDDDTLSDASSDLFEIESFTNKFSCPNSTCYAPSEVSVAWSVVTASVADLSFASDSDDHIASALGKKNKKMAPNAKGEMGKARFGILLGCKSQKAVRVAGARNGKAVHLDR